MRMRVDTGVLIRASGVNRGSTARSLGGKFRWDIDTRLYSPFYPSKTRAGGEL